jgi:hypothetical protein
MPCVHILEALARHVRVDLGRRYAAVTEQPLDHEQIRPVIEQVGRESVSQRVR